MPLCVFLPPLGKCRRKGFVTVGSKSIVTVGSFPPSPIVGGVILSSLRSCGVICHCSLLFYLAACVYETGLLLMFLALTLFLFAYYVALLLLPLSLFLGFRAPSLSLGGFVF